MDSHLLEVKTGVLHTFDGETHEVQGGAYLSPEGYLTTHAELEHMRAQRRAEAESNLVPVVVVGAALLGFAAGFWLGRRHDDD